MRASSFRTRLIAGFAIVIVILVAGACYVIGRLDAVATAEVARIRAEEREITEIERLRWLSEAVVSDGRGYVISGDPEILERARRASEEFDRQLRTLSSDNREPQEAELIENVRKAGEAFEARQRQVIIARAQGETVSEIFERFRTGLVPLRRELADSIGQLVRHKESLIDDVYREGEARRHVLTLWMYALLAGLGLSSVGVSLQFARKLVRAHEEAHDAVLTARQAIDGRDELMGIVAHDLRNPLGSIVLKAAVLEQAADSEKIRRQAASIEEVARRMGRLINTMLDVTTLEAGRFSIEPRTVEIDELLRSSQEVFEGMAVSKGVRLELRQDRPWPAVHADKERVLQVLSNLLGNAIKFTASGGSVGVTLERQGDFVRFTVSDTGVGVDPQNLEHLFDRFWQHSTEGHKGTGLGLFIAKGIVEAHGGEIWAESAPGQGTKVHFTIPLASEQARDKAS